MSAIDRIRSQGRSAFQRLGLPSRKVEAWHYTDLSQLDLNAFAPADQVVSAPAAAGVIHFVNGCLAGAGALPDGVSLVRLEDSAAGLARIGTLLPPDLPLAALNAGLFDQAWVLSIAAGARIEQPIRLVCEARATTPLQFHGRLLVLAEAGSTCCLVESHCGAGRTLGTWVSEIDLAEKARLHHVVLQDEAAEAIHVATAAIELAADAVYRGVQLQFGAVLARREIHALLAGRGADFALDGATLAVGRQHLDNTTRIVHRASHCPSRQLFKTVLDEEGHGVFQGTVLVERPAQKTAAHQLSRALMLSDRAAMDNKPELEIFADDVKCGHGATIGDIDETQLFYLRARGIEEATARRMLVEAFLAEVVEQVEPEELRDEMIALLRERLHIGGRS